MTVFHCTVVYYYTNTYYIELYYDWETFFHSYFLSANGKKTGLENHCAPPKFLMQALQYLTTVVKKFVLFHIRIACIQSVLKNLILKSFKQYLHILTLYSF